MLASSLHLKETRKRASINETGNLYLCPLPAHSALSSSTHTTTLLIFIQPHVRFFIPHSTACTDTFLHPLHTCHAKGRLKNRVHISPPPTCHKTTSCLVTRGTKLNQSHAESATLQRCLQETR